MKKIMSLMAAFLVFSTPGFAILPPLYQDIKEIKSILSSSELGKKLQSGEVLMQIQKNDQGYEITTNYHHLQIDVVYAKEAKIGPAEYELMFHDPVSLAQMSK